MTTKTYYSHLLQVIKQSATWAGAMEGQAADAYIKAHSELRKEVLKRRKRALSAQKN